MRAKDELRFRPNMPGAGVADLGGGTTMAGEGVGWGVFERRIADAERGAASGPSFGLEPGIVMLRDAWRIFARMAEALGVGGGMGAQVCSPSDVSGTGCKHVEHLTVGKS